MPAAPTCGKTGTGRLNPPPISGNRTSRGAFFVPLMAMRICTVTLRHRGGCGGRFSFSSVAWPVDKDGGSGGTPSAIRYYALFIRESVLWLSTITYPPWGWRKTTLRRRVCVICIPHLRSVRPCALCLMRLLLMDSRLNGLCLHQISQQVGASVNPEVRSSQLSVSCNGSSPGVPTQRVKGQIFDGDQRAYGVRA